MGHKKKAEWDFKDQLWIGSKLNFLFRENRQEVRLKRKLGIKLAKRCLLDIIGSFNFNDAHLFAAGYSQAVATGLAL